MKNTKIYNRTQLFLFGVLSMLTSTLSFAQDTVVSKTTNVTTRTEEWQTNPLYWIIGGVILIIIIAIIASSRGRRRDE